MLTEEEIHEASRREALEWLAAREREDEAREGPLCLINAASDEDDISRWETVIGRIEEGLGDFDATNERGETIMEMAMDDGMMPAIKALWLRVGEY